jgi:cell division septum initiation protein DivIVA
MHQPADIIKDIQSQLDRLVRQYRTLLDTNKKLETENQSLTLRLEEAIQQQETLKQKVDAISQTTLRENKGLDQWKQETRKEIKGIIRELEKSLPQVESLLDK